MNGFVQLGEGLYLRDGDEVVAAKPPDVAFDPAFLVGTADAWLAVERVKVEMGPERDPPVSLDTLPGEPDHLGYGCFQVVVANFARRYTTEHGEGRHVAFEEGLLATGRGHSVHGLTGVGHV